MFRNELNNNKNATTEVLSVHRHKHWADWALESGGAFKMISIFNFNLQFPTKIATFWLRALSYRFKRNQQQQQQNIKKVDQQLNANWIDVISIKTRCIRSTINKIGCYGWIDKTVHGSKESNVVNSLQRKLIDWPIWTFFYDEKKLSKISYLEFCSLCCDYINQLCFFLIWIERKFHIDLKKDH